MKDPMKDQKSQKDGNLNQNFNSSGNRQTNTSGRSDVGQQKAGTDYNKQNDKIAPNANTNGGSAKSDRRS